MVKLRSRLIRSPFSGAGEATSATPATPTAATGNTGCESSNNHIRQQHQRQRQVNNRRRNNHGGGLGNNNQQLHQRRTQQQRRQSSNSSASDSSIQATATTTASQRRPFESLGSSLSDSPSTLRSSGGITSPGKRKPETRGITASIRRAKNMFRMASSPMTSFHSSSMSNLGGDVTHYVAAGAGVARASSDGGIVDCDDERMDTSDDHGNVDAAEPSSYTSPVALAFPRTPSQEENVPPMALLSPNSGTFYAHAAGAAAFNYNHKGKAEDPNAMDVDVSGVMTTASAAAAPVPAPPRIKNVLEWMREDAPPELLPKLLSFCGSRKMNALSRVNKAWNEVMKDESVWRVLCEDTHKWSDGDEVPQHSWSQFYKQNPCVPIDYDTIEDAFDSISSGPRTDTIENNVLHAFREQRKTCRILLHPGPYFLRRPLVANVAGNAELTIESVSGLRDPEHGMIWHQNYYKRSSSSSTDDGMSRLPANSYSPSVEAMRPSSPTLRQIFGSCGGRSSSSLALDRSSTLASSNGEDNVNSNTSSTDQSKHRAAFHQSCFQGPRPTTLLCLESRNQNEPVLRIRRGTVNIRGLKFLHYCEGTDIWNGNAAVQVQTAFGRNGRPIRVQPPSVMPTANVTDCDITSLSGRGLVNIDGGISHIHNCNFHNSAATGVYIGGAGSVATMTLTDVVENGVGNSRNPRRGVARGHSGVYVEQGLAKLRDCNISQNTLTGISAISTEQARLHIEESDIRANRSDQMELPPADSGRGVNRNNSIGSTGQGRARSRHLRDLVMMQQEDRRVLPSTPRGPSIGIGG
mmetsp:Transcript_7979/g.14357  ORF Transcript_7979/g.14357 Transcript_7979/m.14357 type:complete len:804 (-) Transcript_7979:130-2541(-)